MHQKIILRWNQDSECSLPLRFWKWAKTQIDSKIIILYNRFQRLRPQNMAYLSRARNWSSHTIMSLCQIFAWWTATNFCLHWYLLSHMSQSNILIFTACWNRLCLIRLPFMENIYHRCHILHLWLFHVRLWYGVSMH